MSATLGSVARQRLSTPQGVTAVDRNSLNNAIAAGYPAITTRGTEQESLIPVERSGRDKTLQVEALPVMEDSSAVASRALQAARTGAKVLIIRNTVAYALQTQQALEEIIRVEEGQTADAGLLFTCNGMVATHHGRYAAADRRRLDAAVEGQIGKERSPGGRIIVGTQTLEQSLDIDADLLITDLCPMDVLLQRIGRLHRHQRADRPERYRSPICLVLTPADADLSPWLTRRRDTNGLGPHGFVYEDLRILEATRRLIAQYAGEGTPWRIPRMNRELVERATHPEELNAITAELGDDWCEHATNIEGALIADKLTARQVIIRRDRSFYVDNSAVVFPDVEEKIRTRLGDEGIEITLDPEAPSPFAGNCAIARIAIPGHLSQGLMGDEMVTWIPRDGGFEFSLGDRRFRYDRLGLQRL